MIEISLKLVIKNNNIVVHINSNDINWEIIRIQPNMEYLLLPENADKIMNNIDKPEIIIIKTRVSIKLINPNHSLMNSRSSIHELKGN